MSIGFQWRGRWWLAAASGLVAVLPPIQATAQQPVPPAAPRVSLAEIKTTPGASLMMPLSLTPDPKNPLRSLTVEIGFVSKSLVFQKTSRGLAAELVNADIEANLRSEFPRIVRHDPDYGAVFRVSRAVKSVLLRMELASFPIYVATRTP